MNGKTKIERQREFNNPRNDTTNCKLMKKNKEKIVKHMKLCNSTK